MTTRQAFVAGAIFFAMWLALALAAGVAIPWAVGTALLAGTAFGIFAMLREAQEDHGPAPGQ